MSVCVCVRERERERERVGEREREEGRAQTEVKRRRVYLVVCAGWRSARWKRADARDRKEIDAVRG